MLGFNQLLNRVNTLEALVKRLQTERIPREDFTQGAIASPWGRTNKARAPRRCIAQITDKQSFVCTDGTTQVIYSWNAYQETITLNSGDSSLATAITMAQEYGGLLGTNNAISVDGSDYDKDAVVEVIESPFETGIWYIVKSVFKGAIASSRFTTVDFYYNAIGTPSAGVWTPLRSTYITLDPRISKYWYIKVTGTYFTFDAEGFPTPITFAIDSMPPSIVTIAIPQNHIYITGIPSYEDKVNVFGCQNATPIILNAWLAELNPGSIVQVIGVKGCDAANGIWTVQDTAVENGVNFSLQGSSGNGAWIPGTGTVQAVNADGSQIVYNRIQGTVKIMDSVGPFTWKAYGRWFCDFHGPLSFPNNIFVTGNAMFEIEATLAIVGDNPVPVGLWVLPGDDGIEFDTPAWTICQPLTVNSVLDPHIASGL